MEFPIAFSFSEQRPKQGGMRVTKHETVFIALKEAILEGALPYGTRLPSSRELAAMHGLSRGTVNLAYEQLAAEGYVQGRKGSGTFVAFSGAGHNSKEASKLLGGSRIVLSQWGKQLESLPKPIRTGGSKWRSAQYGISFTTGQPELKSFPASEWARLLYAQVRALNRHPDSEKFEAAGHYPLRAAIAKHLGRTRAFHAHPEQIVIVNGSMQAIAILVQLLINAGDSVVLENPSYKGFYAAVLSVGGSCITAPVDEQGLQVSDWPARLAFVTPGRQFPTGAVLAMDRRQRLLQWADDQEALIVEDDYDTEFRHRGKPLEPLKALDRRGRVIFLGTFSKTMLPYMRIGYVVLPDGLTEAFIRAKQLYEPSPASLLEQRALAEMMKSGLYEKHLRRMRRVYSRKYGLLAEGIRRGLGDWLQLVESDAGLHVFAWWKGSREQLAEFQDRCHQEGVSWSDGGVYFIGEGRPALCLGFSHLEDEQIEEGLERMKLAAGQLRQDKPL
ncbi:MocR-like pyridoxine biosynthesis transcription factor PdxR [Paenibacillus senegalensis]|uniref:MocR-like pyridoxine biosynthesis transcription factor PdxR n=1 Tax=Paenibacillus senegalensis TaxID=1465766 RepID=UPI00028954CB|nr:PLP-dependent aminotransferase family protein [Paenibacillus senegalensis]